MQQFVVEKVNRMGEEAWSTRVLTIDAANHILYLSQRSNVGSLDHHCMVKIKQVNWWPHYSAVLHSTAFLLGSAELTFCVEGSTLNNGPTSPLVRVFHPRTRRSTEEEQAALQRSAAAMTSACTGVVSAAVQRVFVRDTWMLRCTSREDVDAILTALRSAVEDPSCVKGTIRMSTPPPCDSVERDGMNRKGLNAVEV